MAWHVSGDECKVKITTGDKYGFAPAKVGKEVGICIELPEVLHYFGKHSLIIEKSFMDAEPLKKLLDWYKKHYLGKPVAWESLQDRGRHFKFEENGDEVVLIKLSDIIAYGDDVKDLETAEMSDDDRASGGSFAL
jgi:hypothetical protein